MPPDLLDQIPGIAVSALDDPDAGVETRHPAASLEQTDLGEVEAGSTGELILAHVGRATDLSQVESDLLRDGHRPQSPLAPSGRGVSPKSGLEEISNSPRAAEKNRGR